MNKSKLRRTCLELLRLTASCRSGRVMAWMLA